jgi:hypothetical protein
MFTSFTDMVNNDSSLMAPFEEARSRQSKSPDASSINIYKRLEHNIKECKKIDDLV